MPKHVLWIGEARRSDGTLVLAGDEARHAVRVKRVREGEVVLGLDGTGVLVTGEVVSLGRELVVRIVEEVEAPPASPRIEVWAPMPKGNRSGDLVDLLTQVGAHSWVPMVTKRSVSDLTEAKRRRLERVAVEACKQSRRAWALEIGPEQPLRKALKPAGEGVTTLIAEQSGGAIGGAAWGDRVRMLIGPEGGFTEQELDQAREVGAVACSLGPHVMRIETAAAAGCAILMGCRR
ncbi:MAG: 16S rRNA (uracil(1498)-N(3))-methyltransferase [Phycisphaeraceae bacterium]|nr:16S rRNA (uracil(1498)-N(3))-methyltransferase [Phycisphaeraceae bacterium]MCB9847102.1 16S rRNA (uracil(1498)-N(3))-methyltransferase [Phycisphaeraceae bacterium]